MRWVAAMSDIGGAIRSIDELVDEVTRLHALLRGSETYPGILEQGSDLAEKLSAVRDQLSNASRLSEQLDALPERLLRSADDQQFKAALRESIAQVLADSIVDAKLQVEQQAIDVAIASFVSQVKVEMAKLGEGSASFLVERNKLRNELEKEKVKSETALNEAAAIAERMKYFEQDKDASFGLLAAGFADATRLSASARVRGCCICLVIGVVVSLTTLVPTVEQYLKTPSQHYQQR